MAAVAGVAVGETVAAGPAVAEGAADGTGIITFGAATGAGVEIPAPDAKGDVEAATPVAGEGTRVGEGVGDMAVDGGATTASGAAVIRVIGWTLGAGAAIMRADRVGCEEAIVEGAASISFGWDTAFRSSSDVTDG